MAELSERFAELMARLSKSDAELFRTLGEQNASVRQMVEDLTGPAAAAATHRRARTPGPSCPRGVLSCRPESAVPAGGRCPGLGRRAPGPCPQEAHLG